MLQWIALVAFMATTIPIRAQETKEDPLNLMRPFPEQKTCANQIKEMIDLEKNIVKIDHTVKQEAWESYYNCYTDFPGTIHISDTSFFVQLNTPKVGEVLKPDYQINVVYKNFWNQTSVETKDLKLMVNCNEKLRFNIESEYQIGGDYKIGQNDISTVALLSKLLSCMDDRSFFNNMKSCHVPHPLPGMKILDPCEAVEQLVINEMTKEESTEAAIYFVYKLEVLNSNFKDLSFLKMDATKWQNYKTLYDHYADTNKESDGDYNRTIFKSKDDQEIVVQNNKQLCLSLEFEQFFKSRSKTFVLSNNANFDDDSCKVTCNANEAISSYTCNVITEDVDVDCSLIPNYNDTFKTENWAAGIGYNRVTVETGIITLRNCETHTISMYFGRVKNMKDIMFTVQNVTGDIKLIKESPWPKVFKVVGTKEHPVPYMTAAAFEHYLRDMVFEYREPVPRGTCVFPHPAVEVKGCEVIEGDLVLTKESISVDPLFEKIDGCIIIYKTELQHYDFIRPIKHVNEQCTWDQNYKGEESFNDTSVTAIHDNLCIPWYVREFSRLHPTLKSNIKDNHAGCGVECGGTTFGMELKANCRILTGDLKLEKESDLKKVSSIVEVYGRIIIHHNHQFGHLSFDKLEKISWPFSREEPILDIRENNGFESIQMPALQKIDSDSWPKVKITKTYIGDPAPLLETLKRVLNEECSKESKSCYYEEAKRVADLTNSGYGLSNSYYSGNGNNNANDEDEDKAEGQALFISLFVLFGLLMIFAILGIVAGVVYIYCKNVYLPKKRTGKPAGKGGTPVATHWKVPAGLLDD